MDREDIRVKLGILDNMGSLVTGRDPDIRVSLGSRCSRRTCVLS